MQPSKRFVWVNVIGTPLELWGLEFFKVISNDYGGFVTVSRNTLNRRRLDVAAILVPTSMDTIPPSLCYNINDQLVSLKISKTFIPVELLEDDEDSSDDEDFDGHVS